MSDWSVLQCVAVCCSLLDLELQVFRLYFIRFKPWLEHLIACESTRGLLPWRYCAGGALGFLTRYIYVWQCVAGNCSAVSWNSGKTNSKVFSLLVGSTLRHTAPTTATHCNTNSKVFVGGRTVLGFVHQIQVLTRYSYMETRPVSHYQSNTTAKPSQRSCLSTNFTAQQDVWGGYD